MLSFDVKKEVKSDTRKESKYIMYQKMFWLFMIGNLLGVLLEGLWLLFKSGHWETHVVTIWGPFCLIYGVGCTGFYLAYRKLKDKNIILEFLVIALLADIVEYFCGWLLEYGLHMRAWNYSKRFLNLHGHICLEMTIIWGLIGVLFIRVIGPQWDKLFLKIKSKMLERLCIILSIFMAINIVVTVCCMIRWRNRHFNIDASNKISRYIDKKYTDEIMQNRFIEWYFIQ